MTERLELLSLVLFFIIISIIILLVLLLQNISWIVVWLFTKIYSLGSICKYYFLTEGFDFTPM